MLTPKPKSLDLKGSSADITKNWQALTAGLTSGDLVVIAPEGGVLELGKPLTVAGDITITGAAAATSATAPAAGGKLVGRRRLQQAAGAPKGTTLIKCGKGASSAFRVM